MPCDRPSGDIKEGLAPVTPRESLQLEETCFGGGDTVNCEAEQRAGDMVGRRGFASVHKRQRK